MIPVWWSVAGWLCYPSAPLRSLPAASMLAASSWVFGNPSRGLTDSLNLFATPWETAAKFSAVRLPLKRRVSKTPLHSAQSRFRKWAVCVANASLMSATPGNVNSCLHSRETLQFLLGTLMSVGKERETLMLRAWRNPVLRFEKG